MKGRGLIFDGYYSGYYRVYKYQYVIVSFLLVFALSVYRCMYRVEGTGTVKYESRLGVHSDRREIT